MSSIGQQEKGHLQQEKRKEKKEKGQVFTFTIYHLQSCLLSYNTIQDNLQSLSDCNHIY